MATDCLVEALGPILVEFRTELLASEAECTETLVGKFLEGDVGCFLDLFLASAGALEHDAIGSLGEREAADRPIRDEQ